MRGGGYVWDGITKILQVSQKNSIIYLKRDGNFITRIQYGPLGSLLKQNIFNEWISSFLNFSEVSTLFPVEILKPRHSSFHKCTLTESCDNAFFKDIVHHYCEGLVLTKNYLPLGLITYGPCTHNSSDKNEFTNDSSSISWTPETWSRGSMLFFCPPNKATHWFYCWQRQRYHWWRKLSNVPSQFSMSDITQTKDGGQEMSLLLECPWGKEKVETISVSENGFFESLIQRHSAEGTPMLMPDNSNPSVVTCEVEIDLAVFAYLSNSFVLKKRDGELRSIFQFHSKLAPYKVSMSLDATEDVTIKKLNDIVNHLTKDLKKNGISVFPNTDISAVSPQIQFQKFDEMGLPYSVILDETFLKSGIAALRSRDTTLQEQVHATEIVSKLTQYLRVGNSIAS